LVIPPKRDLNNLSGISGMLRTTWLQLLKQHFSRPGRSTRRRRSAPVGAEVLEQRALLATYGVSGTTLNIDLDAANQKLQIFANGTSYVFALSTATTNTWTLSGTLPSGHSMTSSAANLTTANLSAFSTVNITDSAANTSVWFETGSNGTFADNFNVNLDNLSNVVVFNGTNTFSGSNSLSVTIDSRANVPSGRRLTMTDGNLGMSINMQATPQVFSTSGLLVDNGTIETTGTGQTTIEARGGNGSCSTFQNKGVAVVRGGKIIGGTTGNLSITGYGYNNLSIAAITGWQGQGVLVYSNVPTDGLSTVTSRGANVVVTGYGANDTTANLAAITACAIINAGVVVGAPAAPVGGAAALSNAGGLITSGGNGTVTITGYGGSLANQPVYATSGQQSFYSQSMGVFVSGSNASISSGGAGNVSVTGTGGGAYANTPYGIGVHLYFGTIKSGANASVFVNGTGFQNSNTQLQFGVHLYGDSCITTGPGSGSTTVIGQGGGSGNGSINNYGVYLWSGGNATITAGGSGSVTVTGTGGLAPSNNNYGVFLSGNSASNPTITSNGGAVQVNGYGGNGGSGTNSNSYGIQVGTNARITAGGLGDVTVAGYGGHNNGTQGNLNVGVYVRSNGSSQLPGWITSSGGNVTVIGVGGGGDANSTAASSSACNTGVFLEQGTYITAGGMGNVSVTGQGGGRSPGATGNNNHGVLVSDGNRTTYSANNMAYSCISSSGGQVTVTGTGGGGSGSALNSTSANNYGVIVEKAGTITSGGNADVIITGTGGSFGNSTSSGGGSHGVVVTGTQLPTGAPVAYRSTVTTGGSGNVTINGTGGGSGTGSVNVGIVVSNGTLVTAGGATSTVTLNGQGGNTTSGQNFGVCITNVTNTFPATVTSNGGNVSINGCGPLATAGTNQHGINVNTNGTVSSGGSGSVTLTGRGGTGDVGISGAGHVGVVLATNATITSGGTGPVLINGYGGGSSTRAGNYGVWVSGAAAIGGGDTAPVTVNGYGGNANGTGGTNTGVYVTARNSKITSNNGTVQITGIGGQTGTTVSGSGSNYGVFVESGAEASSTGTAPITVNGTGGGLGTGSGGNNHGVMVYTLATGNITPKISSSGGLVTVTGIAGGTNSASNNSHGVIIGTGGLVTTTGNGTDIIINGTGGGGSHPSYTNHGIYMAGTANASNYTITANGGDILLNGTAGPSLGSQGVAACTTVASVIGNPTTRGNITIVTNSADLATMAGSAINASPQLTIRPRTVGVAIDLGNTTGAANSPLAVSAAELATFNAPSIQLGDSTTGNVTISDGITVPSGSNLTLMSNGTGSVLSSTLSTTNLTMGAGKTLDVSTLPIIGTTIDGTTLGTGYSQLKVVGDLSIAGKTLSLSGSHTPAAGNVFTIVDATNLTGTFTGLANGSTKTFNGKTLIVNYTSTSVTLTEPSPVVTTDPTNSTVTAGSAATFTAAASGIPTPTIQWQVSTDAGSSWSNIGGATNTSLSFTATSADDGKLYRAVFTNIYGTAATTSATLTVHYAPTVTTQPTSQTVNPGDTATFTAAASGNPTPTVKWQVDSGSGFVDISGATSLSYSLTASAAENGYLYRAVFTNGVGIDAVSSSATLTVSSGSSSSPVITSHPTSTTVTAGSLASFTAAATGSPTPTVKWQSNSGSGWSDIAGATSGTYSFTAAAGDNGVQYRAVFTNGIGSDATTNPATLTVQYGPTVTTHPTSQTVLSGATVTFTAAASGNPTPTVKWQSNSGSGWSDIAGATSVTYSLTAAAGNNGVQYRAVFTNGIGSDATTNPATLTVQYGPTVTTQPTSQTVLSGTTVTFTAAASGNPTPTVKWQSNSGSGWSDIAGATSVTYSFTATAGDNGVQYRAVFTNGIGSDATTNPATLSVPSLGTFTVSKGQAQRSYVRYLDVGTDSSATASALSLPGRVRLLKADLNGNGATVMPLTGFVSASGSTLAIDFGAAGLGGSRNTNLADGYYTLGMDLDGDGVFESSRRFYRLLGDVNGDRQVNPTDVSLVTAGTTSAYNPVLDINGDGVVNGADIMLVSKARGRKLADGLLLD
jgi:hypothetical protein